MPQALGYPRRPLKTGVHLDLIALGVLTPDEVRWALRIHTGAATYLKSVQLGADRVDLNGAPAGKVLPEDVEYAQRQLAKLQDRKRRDGGGS
jgi:ProP effector